MSKKRAISFEASICGRDDGAIEAIYIKILPDKVSRTVEISGDRLLADYNNEEKLVGIEILAPATIAQLVDLIDADRRSSFRKFISSSIPRKFVHD